MTKSFSAMEKKAAFEALLEHGYSFDQAADAIEKEAGAYSTVVNAVKGVGSAIKGGIKALPTQMDHMSKSMGSKEGLERFTNNRTLASARALGRNSAVQAAGVGAAGIGAAGVAIGRASRSQEKQACLDALMEQGIDFSTAVELVKQAEQDVYGE